MRQIAELFLRSQMALSAHRLLSVLAQTALCFADSVELPIAPQCAERTYGCAWVEKVNWMKKLMTFWQHSAEKQLRR
jgi:hypothetical protein